jgi:hypothetical protein
MQNPNKNNNSFAKIDELASYCERLQISARRYIYEAHVCSLDGVDVCDHDAGVCFCTYHDSLNSLFDILEEYQVIGQREEENSTEAGRYLTIIETRDPNKSFKKFEELTNAFAMLSTNVTRLIASREIVALRKDAKTQWYDKEFFERTIKRIIAQINP